MKYSFIKILFLSIVLLSCKEDVTLLDCATNVSLIIDGQATCSGTSAIGYVLDLDENSEAIGFDILNGVLHLILKPPTGNIFIEGKNYDYKSGEGSSFTGSQLGSIHSGSIKIIKLDRENNLISLEFKLDAEKLPNNNSWNINGTITDLPMIP